MPIGVCKDVKGTGKKHKKRRIEVKKKVTSPLLVRFPHKPEKFTASLVALYAKLAIK